MDTYIYVKNLAKYYWIEEKMFLSPGDAQSNLRVNRNELLEMREKWEIKEYIGLIYRDGGKSWYYNLLKEEDILKPSDTPILHDDIKTLISNIWGYKDENIEYLHKSLLYKLTHLNDSTIGSIVLYGHGGSWKGTYMSLMSTIFWSDNVLANLWQRDLTGNFDTYNGKKLILEFAEVVTNNTQKDVHVLNKLKNIIWAELITVNQKHVKQYQVENIAMFYITSNSNKPIQLDDTSVGNRRFSIIKCYSKLPRPTQVNKSVRNKKIVSDYLAWLFQEFPEVIKYKQLEALENSDKKDLEEQCLNEANAFWDWIKESHPWFKWKQRITEVYQYLEQYCEQNDLDYFETKKFFWHHSRYPKKKVRIWKDTYSGVDLWWSEVTTEQVKNIF